MRIAFHLLEHIRSLTLLLVGRFRAGLLRMRGAVVGAKVTVFPRVQVDNPWCLQIGERVRLEDGVCIKIVHDDARVVVDEFVFLGRGVQLDVQESVSIGKHSLIAPGCYITDHNHGIAPGLRIDQQPCTAEPVVIGEDVLLGANVVILPGVRIGDGAIVGPNAVVTSDVSPMAIVVGVPARPTGHRRHRSTLSSLSSR